MYKLTKGDVYCSVLLPQVRDRVDPGAPSEAGEGALLQREGAGGEGEEAQTVGGETDGEVQHVSQSHLPPHGALKHLTSKWKRSKCKSDS